MNLTSLWLRKVPRVVKFSVKFEVYSRRTSTFCCGGGARSFGQDSIPWQPERWVLSIYRGPNHRKHASVHLNFCITKWGLKSTV